MSGSNDGPMASEGAPMAPGEWPNDDRAGARRPLAAAPRRRRARGTEAAARARLMVAAERSFAEQGFAAVSTRALARQARVTLSAIAYHFGGKEGLYRAVVGGLIADTEPLIGPAVARLEAGVVAAGGDRAALARLTAAFVRGLVTEVLTNPRMRAQMTLMLREFHKPSAVFATLLAERIDPLHDAVCRLIGAAQGVPETTPTTRLLAATVVAQCMAPGAARAVLFARLGWDRYTAERVRLVADVIAGAVIAMLGLPPGADQG